MVERLFLAVPRGCLRFVIVVFPDHTNLLFYTAVKDNLSDSWSEELSPGQNVVYIIDAIAFIQKHEWFGCTTFDEL